MKRFAIAAIVFVDAPTKEKADDLAGRHVQMKNGSCLLLDETLPTVEVSAGGEYPHSLLDIPEMVKEIKLRD